MTKQTRAYIYAGTAVLLWSTEASAFKVSLRYLEVPQVLFFAALVSTVVLFAIVVAQGKLRLVSSYSPRQYAQSALLGGLNPFIYYLVLFKAYDLLPAQEAQPLNYTWPVVVAILSVPLLKQRISRISMAAILVSFFGVFVIATRGDILGFRFTDLIGVALAVGSAVIWATYWLANVRDGRDDAVKLFLSFSFGLVLVTVAAVVLTGLELGDLRGVGAAAWVGVFEMGVTFVLWMRALSLSRTAAQVSNLIYLSPFLSLIFISLIVGETILLSSIVGLVFIIGGIVIRQFDRAVPEPG